MAEENPVTTERENCHHKPDSTDFSSQVLAGVDPHANVALIVPILRLQVQLDVPLQTDSVEEAPLAVRTSDVLVTQIVRLFSNLGEP
ncbi:hypothetical protein NPIL_19941 [Nephila pilipes]|uniref:Uncharacterized protein n=1 Tax=Nephila pilipes TaxID=299642 RepID=A0A8X6U3D1_NEPPI|nr:hypothetical protein NPIL_19941 [Nephila pilipes]